MSALTLCNHCSLEMMQRIAAENGVEVIIEVVHTGDMRGWTTARYSDQAEPSAWFMQLTYACAC